jgi:L-threonylcarbamoyladenylate synthase
MSQLFAGTDSQAIATAAALLRAGEVVAFPTETVYGLGADALNERAVAQVFAIKNRPRFDPLIVHVPDKDTVALYATDIDERAVALMGHFWPGPLTLVLRKRSNIPDLITAGLDTVAIRVPAHPVALALLRAAQGPVAAPSANPFGYVSPTTALHVQESLGNAIPLILDGGPCTVGVESTVCALTEAQAVILRPGGVSVEAIEAVIGPVAFVSPTQADAANLFAALRRLDAAVLDTVIVEPVPEHGLGRAIMDRLRRAATH